MKTRFGCMALLIAAQGAFAAVPKEINHQGVVSVNGQKFDGTGLFRFAIVDPDSGTNLWSNDGSITDAVGGEPAAAVSLTVTKGVYTVILGDINDATMPNMTEAIASSVFADDNAVLRIWFDDGVNGLHQLTPDHKLTTAPYSARLPNVFVNDSGDVGIGTITPQAKLDVDGEIKGFGIVPIGSIIAWHQDIKDPDGGTDPLPLPDGWVRCDGQTLSDPESPLNGHGLPDLNGAISGIRRFLRGTTGISGTMQADELKSHQHQYQVRLSDGGPVSVTPRLIDRSSTDFGGGPFWTAFVGGSESRPFNMSVVWIMRVK